MTKQTLIPIERIEQAVLLIRGRKVMLDAQSLQDAKKLVAGHAVEAKSNGAEGCRR